MSELEGTLEIIQPDISVHREGNEAQDTIWGKWKDVILDSG